MDPAYDQILFGDGTWAQIISRKNIVNDDGIDVTVLYLAITPETAWLFGISKDDLIDGQYIKKTYLANTLLLLGDLPTQHLFFCLGGFESGEPTAIMNLFLLEIEQCNNLQSQITALRRERALIQDKTMQLINNDSSTARKEVEILREHLKLRTRSPKNFLYGEGGGADQ